MVTFVCIDEQPLGLNRVLADEFIFNCTVKSWAMLPMFFMDNESGVLNFLVISAYIAALLFTVWSMYLMGRILILSEKHSHN